MGHRKESNGGSMSMNSRQSSPSHKLHEKYEKKKKQQQLTKTDTSVLCHNLKTTNGHSDNGQQGKSVSFHVARGAVAFLDSSFLPPFLLHCSAFCFFLWFLRQIAIKASSSGWWRWWPQHSDMQRDIIAIGEFQTQTKRTKTSSAVGFIFLYCGL